MSSLYHKARMQSRTAAVAHTVLTLVALFVGMAIPAQAQVPTPTTLCAVETAPTDAASSYGAIALGRDRNLYGMGIARGADPAGGVFRITRSGTETLLVSFPANWTSCNGLTLGMDGNFYEPCAQSGTASKEV